MWMFPAPGNCDSLMSCSFVGFDPLCLKWPRPGGTAFFGHESQVQVVTPVLLTNWLINWRFLWSLLRFGRLPGVAHRTQECS